ncbi:MAG: hypothetical protein RJA59_400 [Pseudomonadota bacterium]
MTDRPTTRTSGRLALILATAGILGCALEAPVPSFGAGEVGPCVSDTTVETSTVVISGGLFTPRCVSVPAGTSVRVVNEDPLTYLFLDTLTKSGPNLEVPGRGSATTEPISTSMFYESVQLPGTYLSITPR